MTVKKGTLRYYTALTPDGNDREITREEARELLKTSYDADKVDEIIDNRNPLQLELKDESIVYTTKKLKDDKWGPLVPAPGLYGVWYDESIIEG